MKTPAAVHAWHLPPGVTPAAAGVLALAALVVIFMLARAVGRLSRAAVAAAAPAPASSSSGGAQKLVLLAAAGGGVWWLLSRHKTAGATAQAAPAPTPSPSPTPTPTPTVTQTVAPHITGPVHHLLTGGDIVALYVIAAVVAIVIIGQVIRRSS